MRKRMSMALAVALLAALVPVGARAVDTVVCPEVPEPTLAFGEKVWIDRHRAGGEPVSIVAQDGSINVSAHAGTTHIYKDPSAAGGIEDFAYGYTNQTLNWRSDDGGKSWDYVGFAGLREGPHSATSNGFSDPDYAMDADGRIYNVEINLANIAVYTSTDDGQSYTSANPVSASGDRPWLTASVKDRAWLYVNLPKQLWRTDNGGISWNLVSTNLPTKAKIFNDPRNFANGLIGPVGSSGIAISPDGGATWKTHNGATLGKNTDFFGVMAVDKAGHAYRAAAGGYTSSDYSTRHVADGQVTFDWFNRDTESWGGGVTIPTPEGDALWPWIVAGDEGRVAIAWYQTLKENPEAFYIYVAVSENAQGTTVTCSDGSTQFIPPKFAVANASGGPIHNGVICLSGTNCNTFTNFKNGDRRLGDFFTVNFDKDGRVFVASGDTTLKSPTGGTKPVGNPIFIAQTEGPRMLTEPMQTRKSRCRLHPIQTTC